MKKRFFLLVIIISTVISFSAKSAEQSINKELKFGLLPYISATRLIKTFLPLKQHLEKSTSYKITLLTAATFEKFIERTQDQQYDMVFTAPHFALLANREAQYRRLVRFSRELAACVFVCDDNKAHTLAELKGASISTPNSLAIVSVLGEVMLKNSGLFPSSDIDFVRTSSHTNALLSVSSKGSDAGIVASGVYEQFLLTKSDNKKLRLLSCSESVPTAMFLVNNGLPEKNKKMLQRILLTFPQSNLGKQFFKHTRFKGMKLITEKDMIVMEKYMEVLQARL